MSKPAPRGWNKTIDDLFEEMKQGKRLMMVGGDECDWARDYERSLKCPLNLGKITPTLFFIPFRCGLMRFNLY